MTFCDIALKTLSEQELLDSLHSSKLKASLGNQFEEHRKPSHYVGKEIYSTPPDKGVLSNTHKELLKYKNKNQPNQNYVKELKKIKTISQVAAKHVKMFSTPYVIRNIIRIEH